jgi:hypothetical protein
MEQEIKEAIGLSDPQLAPEPEPEPTPEVTIYDFADLLSKNEPQKK